MPSIWKAILRPKAEPYQFPKAEELVLEEEEASPDGPPVPPPGEDGEEAAPAVDIRIGDEAPAPEPEPQEPELTAEELLLAEIRDLLREKNGVGGTAGLDAESAPDGE